MPNLAGLSIPLHEMQVPEMIGRQQQQQQQKQGYKVLGKI
jgi:hypothetical protein